MFWATTVTLASATTEVVVASGIGFSGYTVASGQIQIVPVSVINPTSSGSFDAALLGHYYIEKDQINNIVKLKTTVASSIDTKWDIYISLGEGAEFKSTDSNQIWKRRDNYSM